MNVKREIETIQRTAQKVRLKDQLFNDWNRCQGISNMCVWNPRRKEQLEAQKKYMKKHLLHLMKTKSHISKKSTKKTT